MFFLFICLAARMADGGLGRFRSLPDMSSGSETTNSLGNFGRGLDNLHGNTSSSVGDIPSSYVNTETERGIDLLIAGSPISEHTVIDTEILD